jgi:hypothetical protein
LFDGGSRAPHDVNWTFRLPLSVPVATAADPVPDSEHSDPGSGCAESVKDTWLPEILPARMPEKMTSVTGGDVSTDAGPEAVSPSSVAVHVTRSAWPPPDPWPMTPDHVPLKFTGGDGIVPAPPQLATTTEIKLMNVRRIHEGIETPTRERRRWRIRITPQGANPFRPTLCEGLDQRSTNLAHTLHMRFAAGAVSDAMQH